MLLQELSSYSRVNPLTVTPPWCVTVCVSGHAYNKDFGAMLPEYDKSVLEGMLNFF